MQVCKPRVTSAGRQQPASRTAVVSAAEPKIGGKACQEKVALRRDVQSQGKVFKVKFLAEGGDSRTIDCPDDKYILDAAEAQGIDLPATCRGGICGACVARVVKGTVDHGDIDDLEFTVSAEEQAAGMSLLCMARATSDLEVETQCDWGYSLGVGDWKGASGRFSATPEKLVLQAGLIGMSKTAVWLKLNKHVSSRLVHGTNMNALAPRDRLSGVPQSSSGPADIASVLQLLDSITDGTAMCIPWSK